METHIGRFLGKGRMAHRQDFVDLEVIPVMASRKAQKRGTEGEVEGC